MTRCRCPAARRRAGPARSRAADAPATLFLTPQILCEFYSIVTDPRRVPDPRTAAEAMAAISSLLAFLHVLPVPAHAVDGLLDLLRRHPVTGGDVFDLQIVATMQANGVERIYTFNTDDFTVFPELSIVTPGLPDNILCPRAPSTGAAGQVNCATQGRSRKAGIDCARRCFSLVSAASISQRLC